MLITKVLVHSPQCLASIRHQRLSFTAQGERLPGANSLYDDFAFTHNALDHSAHQNAYFLPWRASPRRISYRLCLFADPPPLRVRTRRSLVSLATSSAVAPIRS